jgi:hypothetical protein
MSVSAVSAVVIAAVVAGVVAAVAVVRLAASLVSTSAVKCSLAKSSETRITGSFGKVMFISCPDYAMVAFLSADGSTAIMAKYKALTNRL